MANNKHQTAQRASGRPSGIGAWLLLPLLAVFGSAKADYADEWGPDLGSALPVLEAYDQNGTLRALDNLTGDQGLLLFLNRSADW